MGSFRRQGLGFVSWAESCRVRYRLWHLMVVVAIVALILGGYVYLFPPDSHVHDYFLVINGHEFRASSPVFWLILTLTVAVLSGHLVGFVVLIVWAARAIRRRPVRNK